MKIVVLAGGYSPERDVSLSSGALIANSLLKSNNEVMLLDLYLGKNSKDFPAVYKTKEDNEVFSHKIENTEPDLEKLKKESGNGEVLIGEGVLDICMDADVVFMALHGGIGENGKLQALFDIFNINYTGSSSIGSMLAMDKDLSKIMMKANNINTAPWITMTKDKEINIDKIKLPCVVKPCGCGSSVGVSIAKTKEELEKAISLAEIYEDDIIIENYIEGREFSIGILDNEALPPIEIEPKEDFYNYKNKYQAGSTIETCPANLEEEITKKMQAEALRIHQALKLGFYSRVDFILDENNDFYCLEANTLPGMTPTSLLPQEAAADGLDYDVLCDIIVRSAKTKKRSI